MRPSFHETYDQPYKRNVIIYKNQLLNQLVGMTHDIFENICHLHY